MELPTPPPAHPAAGEQKSGLRKPLAPHNWEMGREHKEPQEPSLQQLVPAAPRLRPGTILAPTVCIWNSGWKPATHRGQIFKAAGSPELHDSSQQIPHRDRPDS